MPALISPKHRPRLIRAATCLTAAFAALLLFTVAPAQAQVPEICDQYPGQSVCQQPFADDENGTPLGGGPTSEGGATLPFTGYPLTPLVLLALLMFLLSLLARAVAQARERHRASAAQTGAGPLTGP